MLRLLKLPITIAATVVLALALFSTPTSAHQSEVSQGNDFAVTATNHQSGSVCDMEADGHFVSARWYDDEGYVVGYEEDGGDAGCDETQFNGTADTVVVCEIDVGAFWCTDVHKV